MIDMMEAGRLHPGQIVTEEIALEDVPDTIERMDDYDTVGIPVVTAF
jgi:threonine dehydrogenase-like Zn-dependent dehydrogenase